MIKPFTTGLLALAALLAPTAEAATTYVVANQAAVGIARAFDDGENTVLAFADLDSQSPALSDKAGKKIRFHRVGDYAVLPGRFDKVVVDVAGAHGVVMAADHLEVGDEAVESRPSPMIDQHAPAVTAKTVEEASEAGRPAGQRPSLPAPPSSMTHPQASDQSMATGEERCEGISDTRLRLAGKSLSIHDVLRDWTAPTCSKWKLIWDAKADSSVPKVKHDLRVDGDMEAAIQALIKATSTPKGAHPLSIRLFTRQHLIVVNDRK